MNARNFRIPAVVLMTWSVVALAQTTPEPPPAVPSPADARYTQRVEPKFLNFAGSSENLSSITTGLRHGTQFTITDGTESAMIDPPTKPMGYGNITRALDLANRDLAAQGITDPTPSQTAGALNEVLNLRSQGMGWGQIAHTLNLHPGLGSTKTAVSAPTGTPTSSGSASGSTANTAGGTTSTSGATKSGITRGLESGSSGGVTTALGTRVTQPGAGRGGGVRSVGHATTTHAASSGGAVTAAGGSASATGAAHGKGNAYGRGGKN